MKHTNIIKCSTCNGNFIAEEYDLHDCQKLKITVFDTDGNRWGSHNKVDFFSLPPFAKLTDESLHPDRDDDDRREVNSTLFWVLLS